MPNPPDDCAVCGGKLVDLVCPACNTVHTPWQSRPMTDEEKAADDIMEDYVPEDGVFAVPVSDITQSDLAYGSYTEELAGDFMEDGLEPMGALLMGDMHAAKLAAMSHHHVINVQTDLRAHGFISASKAVDSSTIKIPIPRAFRAEYVLTWADETAVLTELIMSGENQVADDIPMHALAATVGLAQFASMYLQPNYPLNKAVTWFADWKLTAIPHDSPHLDLPIQEAGSVIVVKYTGKLFGFFLLGCSPLEPDKLINTAT